MERTAADASVVERPAAPEAASSGRSAEVVRVPRVAPLAPVLGWLTAWGAAIVAAGCLAAAGVPLGLGLGIAEGGPGVEDRLWPGVWMLAIQAGAFVAGGYTAARLARARGLLHAALAWVVAMLATAADAAERGLRDAGTGVLADLRLPYWVDTGLGGWWETTLALGAMALAALAGAAAGGLVGDVANRAARRDAAPARDAEPVPEAAREDAALH